MHRKRRECLECVEREAYVDECRRDGQTEITVRCKNRYIDEFLRYCLETHKHADASRVKALHVKEFAQRLRTVSVNDDTVRAKLAAVLAWLMWLHETGRIKSNPTTGLSAAGLLRDPVK